MSADILELAGIDPGSFVQENQSRSRRGTLRGLHMRRELRESKVVRCARGTIFEAVVDLRPWSPTFGQWQSFTLDDIDHRQIFVPAGCAHGFQVISDWADVCYKHDAYYAPDLEAALAWNDPELRIPWPIARPILSPRDAGAPQLSMLRSSLAQWFGSEAPSSFLTTRHSRSKAAQNQSFGSRSMHRRRIDGTRQA